MKHPTISTIIIGALLSAAVWAISPWATGHKEPWDANGLFYIASLIGGGFVSGLLTPKPLWAQYVGSVSGQLIYELLFLRIGPLFVLGAGFLLGYSFLFLIGAFLGSRVRLFFSKRTSGA